MSELNEYIKGASNEKAPGESQIPAEALKALSPTPRECSSTYYKTFSMGKLTQKNGTPQS
jgi:hypothetical protein